MSVIFTDDFASGGNQLLETYDSDYVHAMGGAGNGLIAVSGSPGSVQAEAAGADIVYGWGSAIVDQQATIDATIQGLANGDFLGAAVRVGAAGSEDGYTAIINDGAGGSLTIYELPSFTSLASQAETIVAETTYRIRFSAETDDPVDLSADVDGGTALTVQDDPATYTSGRPGVSMFVSSTDNIFGGATPTTLANFEVDNLVSGTPVASEGTARALALATATSTTTSSSAGVAAALARAQATSDVLIDAQGRALATGQARAAAQVLVDATGTARALPRVRAVSTVHYPISPVRALPRARATSTVTTDTPGIVRASPRVQGASFSTGTVAESLGTVREHARVRSAGQTTSDAESTVRTAARTRAEVDLTYYVGPVRALPRVRASSTVSVAGTGGTVRALPRVSAPPLVAAQSRGAVLATAKVRAASTVQAGVVPSSGTSRTVGGARASSTTVIDATGRVAASPRIRATSTTIVASTGRALGTDRLRATSVTAGELDAHGHIRVTARCRATSTTIIATPGTSRSVTLLRSQVTIFGAEPTVDSAISRTVAAVYTRSIGATIIVNPGVIRGLPRVVGRSTVAFGSPAVDASLPRLFLGERGGNRLFQANVGHQDAGQGIAIRIETDPGAPAGPGGEAIFTGLYFVCTLHNQDALEPFDTFTLTVTPIVDGAELEPQTVELTVTDTRRQFHGELGLSIPYIYNGVEQARFAARGTFFSARFDVDAVPAGLIILDGVAVEYEMQRESLQAEPIGAP